MKVHFLFWYQWVVVVIPAQGTMGDNLNFDYYLEYVVATQRTWRFNFDIIKTLDQHKKLCHALKKSHTVEKLIYNLNEEIHLLFCEALRENTSLKILFVDGIRDESIANLYDALASRSQFRQFRLCNYHDFALAQANKFKHQPVRVEYSAEAFSALLRFLRANKDLESLNFNGTLWEAGRIPALFTALKDLHKLKYLNIGDLFELSKENIRIVVDFINNTPSIEQFVAEFDQYDEIVARVTNPSVLGLRVRAVPPLAADTNEPLTLAATADQFFWEQLPLELTKSILYALNIGPLTALLTCSKQLMALARQWNVWREYYQQHFHCVPHEMLELINLYEGHKLMTRTSLDSVRAQDAWRMLLKYTMTAHGSVDPRDFPLDRRPVARRLLAPIYQVYPQLLGCVAAEYQPDDRSEEALGFSNPSVYYVWFATKNTQAYSLGFELLRDGRMNGIMLVGMDTQNATTRGHFNFMNYVFEWVTATSVKEFQSKIKPLCEILLATQEHTSYFKWPTNYTDNKIFGHMNDSIMAFRHDYGPAIDQEAKRLVLKCNPDPRKQEAFAAMIESMTGRWKCAPIAVHEYSAMKQTVAARSVLNAKYGGRLENDFHSYGDRMKNPAAIKAHLASLMVRNKRPKKLSGPPAVSRLIRTVTNVIVLPLCRAFWPSDITDSDLRHYPHLKIDKYSFLNVMESLYQHPAYTPVEFVSVSRAQPSGWPLLAVAVAHIIRTPLCRTIEFLIDLVWCHGSEHNPSANAVEARARFESELTQFIAGLSRLGLLPASHITMVNKLFTELGQAAK